MLRLAFFKIFRQALREGEQSAPETSPPPLSDYIYLKDKCEGCAWGIFCRRSKRLWTLHLSKAMRQQRGLTDEDKDLLAESLLEFLGFGDWR